MPSYPLTLNGTFIMKREGASYYGFPEPKYIPHFKEILSRFDIFHDCTLLKQVYFTKRTQSKAIWPMRLAKNKITFRCYSSWKKGIIRSCMGAICGKSRLETTWKWSPMILKGGTQRWYKPIRKVLIFINPKCKVHHWVLGVLSQGCCVFSN